MKRMLEKVSLRNAAFNPIWKRNLFCVLTALLLLGICGTAFGESPNTKVGAKIGTKIGTKNDTDKTLTAMNKPEIDIITKETL